MFEALRTWLRCVRVDQRGASAVEYGLLIAGIAAVITLAVYAFGGVITEQLFTTTCVTVQTELGSDGTCTTTP